MSAAARFNELTQSKGWPVLCDDGLGFDAPKLKDALAYWQERRGTNPMPKRADLSPHGMKSFLSLVSLAEQDKSADGKVRWRTRLQGSDLDRMHGAMTGRYVDEVIKGEMYTRWIATIQFVVDSWSPMRFVSEIASPDREPVVMETMLAPLSSDGSAFDMLFGVSAIRAHLTWDKVSRPLLMVKAN